MPRTAENFAITKYRFVKLNRNSIQMEAEIIGSEGQMYYVNVSIDGDSLPNTLREDECWVYTRPVDEVDFEDIRSYCVSGDFTEVEEKMIAAWNSSPEAVFRNHGRFTEWKRWKEGGNTKRMKVKDFIRLSTDGIMFRAVDANRTGYMTNPVILIEADRNIIKDRYGESDVVGFGIAGKKTLIIYIR